MNFPLGWITSLIKKLLYSAKASTLDFNQCHLISESLLSFKIYLIFKKNVVQFAMYSKLQFTTLIDVSVIKTATEEKKKKNKQTILVLYVIKM